MAIALVALVGYLLAELAAHTLVVLGAFETAGAVASCALESFLHRLYDGLVLVKAYFHYLFSSIFFARDALGT